eukprot:scaffold3199_cov113-Isochrysis_galbana.AAC.5
MASPEWGWLQPHVGGSTACSTTADHAPTIFGGRCGVGGGGGRSCVNSRVAAARARAGRTSKNLPRGHVHPRHWDSDILERVCGWFQNGPTRILNAVSNAALLFRQARVGVGSAHARCRR